MHSGNRLQQRKRNHQQQQKARPSRTTTAEISTGHQQHYKPRTSSSSSSFVTTTTDYSIMMMSSVAPEPSKTGGNTTNGSSNGQGNLHIPTAMPRFAFSEITLGRVIGQGGFSNVSDIISMDLQEVYDIDDAVTAARMELAKRVNQKRDQGEKYVLKTLRTDLPEEEHAKGVLDLAIEAEFLSVVKHPNIVQLRGTANTDPHHNRFFVILDRLTQTLELRFNYWRKLVGDNTGYWIPCLGFYCCSKAPALYSVWKERMTTARDLARAVAYLHGQNIVYRDLKPDNIGFTTEGVVQIFDFGLAKRLADVEKTPDGSAYLLTGNTGSLRFMAPEVAMDRPYGLPVDAYSFGILFWQICSLTTPYAGYSPKMHADRVVREGLRPKPDRSWPEPWSRLMEDCWNANPAVRPDFGSIVQKLEEFVQFLEEEEDVIPTNARYRIKSKKRRKQVQPENASMDVDTRLAGNAVNSISLTHPGVDDNNHHNTAPRELDTQIV